VGRAALRYAPASFSYRRPKPKLEPMDLRARQRLIWEANRDRDVETLIAGLTDPDVRTWAARYLGKLGDPVSIRPLMRLLSAHDFHARASAAKALGKLQAVEAVPALLECVDRGPEDVMRAWAIDALGKIGSKDAVPKLIELLRDSHEGLRRTAAAALAAIGDPRALEPLEQAARLASWRERRHHRRMMRQLRRSKRQAKTAR
jgi:HEAT repeat protein